jgi:transposase
MFVLAGPQSQRLGRISKQGNRHLRWLLVAGAMAVIRYARQHDTKGLGHDGARLAVQGAEIVAGGRECF